MRIIRYKLRYNSTGVGTYRKHFDIAIIKPLSQDIAIYIDRSLPALVLVEEVGRSVDVMVD